MHFSPMCTVTQATIISQLHHYNILLTTTQFSSMSPNSSITAKTKCLKDKLDQSMSLIKFLQYLPLQMEQNVNSLTGCTLYLICPPLASLASLLSHSVPSCSPSVQDILDFLLFLEHTFPTSELLHVSFLLLNMLLPLFSACTVQANGISLEGLC